MLDAKRRIFVKLTELYAFQLGKLTEFYCDFIFIEQKIQKSQSLQIRIIEDVLILCN